MPSIVGGRVARRVMPRWIASLCVKLWHGLVWLVALYGVLCVDVYSVYCGV